MAIWTTNLHEDRRSWALEYLHRYSARKRILKKLDCRAVARIRGRYEVLESINLKESKYNIILWLRYANQQGSVVTVLIYGLEHYGFDSGLEISLFRQTSRPALESTQPPTERVPVILSPGVEHQVREAEHSPHLALRLRMSGAIPLLHNTP
jgi:hypothetical protein